MPREVIRSAAVLLRLPLAQMTYTGRSAGSSPHRTATVRSGISRAPGT